MLISILVAGAILAHQAPDERLAELDLAIRLEPNNSALYLERATLLRRVNRLSEALRDAQRAGNKREQGLILAAQGAHEAAVAKLAEVKDARALAARARCNLALDKPTHALTDFDRAIALGATPELVLESY